LLLLFVGDIAATSWLAVFIVVVARCGIQSRIIHDIYYNWLANIKYSLDL